MILINDILCIIDRIITSKAITLRRSLSDIIQHYLDHYNTKNRNVNDTIRQYVYDIRSFRTLINIHVINIFDITCVNDTLPPKLIEKLIDYNNFAETVSVLNNEYIESLSEYIKHIIDLLYNNELTDDHINTCKLRVIEYDRNLKQKCKECRNKFNSILDGIVNM